MKIKILLLFFYTALVFSSVKVSMAGDCTSGAPDFASGKEGTIKFVNSDMMYCNGTIWVSLKPLSVSSSGPCSQAGRIEGEFYCDGVNLYSMVSSISPDLTSNAPLIVTGGALSYFNGSMNIKSSGAWNIAGTCINNCSGTMIAVGCASITKKFKCIISSGCAWGDYVNLVGPWGCYDDGGSISLPPLDEI